VRIVLIVLGVIVAIILLTFGALYGASELGGEVLVLHRYASDGGVEPTRIWIVENQSGAWIEHGDPDAPWMARLSTDPMITLERHGTPNAYRARPDPDAHELYHRLRKEQYGWASTIVDALTGDYPECGAIPVKVELADAHSR